uniref:Uncharacterized protein n=1 Tax=Mola mola TaxID=94237 RepID=A0A3Q3W455_MOLML
MEREAENVGPWSGFDGSQEPSESLADSYYEDDDSDAEYPVDPQPTHIPKSETESPDHYQSQEWESTGEQQSLPEFSGSDEDSSFKEEDDIYLSESREVIPESPQNQTPRLSLSPHPQYPESVPQDDQVSQPHSRSSSAIGFAADMTLALTFTTEQAHRANNKQGPETLNRGVDSSEEGGSGEAPPASVFFGISDEGAEQGGKWNSGSDTDLCRSERHRARHTRITHNESQSERQAKENKSKCKRIARLLTDAPNPQNKGALLFKKRRQRVKKYTLVSYGTGDNKLDSEDQIEEESEEATAAGYNFVATSESELEEEYSVHHQQYNLSPNWGSVRDMEALPETKGKGVLMFAQRRKRMDEIESENEALRNKGIPVKTLPEPKCREEQNIYDAEKKYYKVNYMDVNVKQQMAYQGNTQQMNHLSNVSRPLVANRTAKPFLGYQNSKIAPVVTSGIVPVAKKHEPFRASVININSQFWSPTGDMIASRDERISVPAIKTGILPESRRRVTSKQSHMLAKDIHFRNKGERRSYIESEEDCFSLGAEACNFMQPQTVKLKNPPPVAPKPTINPACPPFLSKSLSYEPFIPPRSPGSEPCQSAPTRNSWSQQPSKLDSAPHSVASCPPQAGNSCVHASNTSQSFPRGQVSHRGTGNGPTMEGKGAELFAKRLSRMEKFVVDAETVQANETRCPSSTSSLPNYWRYYSNVRAPPPLSYNPLLAPFYPQSATKQPPSTSPTIKPKTQEKDKRAPKQRNTLDITKHQPYQLETSLFKNDAVPEAKRPSPKPITAKVTENFKYSFAPSHSTDNTSEPAIQSNAEVFAKSLVLVTFSPASLIARGACQMAPRPKFCAKKPIVTGPRSLSLPRQLHTMPNTRPLSADSTPGIRSSFLPTQRETSFQDKVYKPLSPWEAASRSPFGSVDEAFVFQRRPSSVASNIITAGHRRSLSALPDYWKRRVCVEPAAVSVGHYHVAPAFQTPSIKWTFSTNNPAVYGRPFRPIQPLRPASKASTRYMAQESNLTIHSPFHSAIQRS